MKKLQISSVLALIAVALLSVTVELAATTTTQNASNAFVAWARENAIPIATTEPGQGFEDLQPLKEVVGNARVVGLGESVHGAHEFFEVRHRLLEFLVEEMGFTAFAMETGLAEAVAINEYVLGRREEPERWVHNWFTWGFGAETELQALVRWMRSYNDDPAHLRKLRFYGIDVPIVYSSPLTALEGAWGFLEEVDPPYAASSRRRLLPLVEPFLGQGGGVRLVSLDKYLALSTDVRDAYSAAVADLIAHFETRRLDYIGRSSEEAYEWAYRYAVAGRQLDRGFRARAVDGGGYRAEASIARDRGMAENVIWALEREGPDGRIVLWAHNAHLVKSPFVWQGFAHPPRLGQFLASILGDDYVNVGFTYYQGNDSGWKPDQTDIPNPPPPGSLDEAMALVRLPMFVLDLRSVPKGGPVYEWLNQIRGQRMSVPESLQLNPLQAWDALFHIDRISPAQVEVAPN